MLNIKKHFAKAFILLTLFGVFSFGMANSSYAANEWLPLPDADTDINPVFEEDVYSVSSEGKDVIKTAFDEILKVIRFLAYFLAVLVITWTGILMILGSEESAKKAKGRIGYVISGLIVLLLIDNGVTFLYGERAVGSGPQIGGLQTEIIGLMTYFLGFVGIASLIVLIYAGFLWLTAGVSEDQVKQAKSLITGAVIGIVIIISAYVIVTTFFQPPTLAVPPSASLFIWKNLI